MKNWTVLLNARNSGQQLETYRLDGTVSKGGKEYYVIAKNIDTETYMREDGSKVYCYYEDLGREELIYDFSLEEGDTQKVYCLEIKDYVEVKVTGIDNIEYDNFAEADHKGQLRRLNLNYEIKGQSLQCAWIEGVGSDVAPHVNLAVNSDMQLVLMEEQGGEHSLVIPQNKDGLYVAGNVFTGKKTKFDYTDETHGKLMCEQVDGMLHVYGYVPRGGVSLYAVCTQCSDGTVWCSVIERGMLCDCLDNMEVDMMVPFATSAPSKVLDIMGNEIPIKDSSALTLPNKDYGSAMMYDMLGRPSSEIQNVGVHVVKGRKIVKNQVAL